MPTEYLDRATALSVGQHWKASELVAALRKMRYEHATGRVGRGEYLWSSSSGDAAEVGGGAAWLTLSVHLVHENRVLDVGLQVVAASEGEGVDGVDGGDGSDDGDEMEYGTFDLDLNLDLNLHLELKTIDFHSMFADVHRCSMICIACLVVFMNSH